MADTVRTITCPVCGELPATAIGPTQALCHTDNCPAMMFSFLDDPAEQRANSLNLDLTGGGKPTRSAVAGLEQDPTVLAGRADDPDWCGQAARIRAFLHAWGYQCAGDCPVCDPRLQLTAGQSADVLRILAEALAEAPTSFPAVVDTRHIKELLASIGTLYGAPGRATAAETLLTGL